MKSTLIALTLAASVAAPVFAASETFVADPSHTYANFSINHFGMSNVNGRFNTTEGKIVLDRVAKSGSIDVTIDTNSLDTGWAKRDEHLKSPDFFDVAKFPSMNFKSTKLNFTGDNLTSVDGTLTLHGVSKPVTLALTSFVCKPHPMMKVLVCAANATTVIHRSEFGVSLYSPNVGEDVNVTIGIEALKQ